MNICLTPLQRIFLTKHEIDPIRMLELTTVTYGTSSAQFLAARALLQLAIDEEQKYSVASSIVKRSIYVDNALFEFDDKDQAKIEQQLIEML